MAAYALQVIGAPDSRFKGIVGIKVLAMTTFAERRLVGNGAVVMAPLAQGFRPGVEIGCQLAAFDIGGKGVDYLAVRENHRFVLVGKIFDDHLLGGIRPDISGSGRRSRSEHFGRQHLIVGRIGKCPLFWDRLQVAWAA